VDNAAGKVKPRIATDVNELALKKSGLPAGACVAIEDSKNGLQASVAAGIATVMTPGIYTSGHSFERAALVVNDLTAMDFQEIYRLTSPAE
jgi:beta-phosphoglucomutase-like phosphatase (HAD superfamily)